MPYEEVDKGNEHKTCGWMSNQLIACSCSDPVPVQCETNVDALNPTKHKQIIGTVILTAAPCGGTMVSTYA